MLYIGGDAPDFHLLSFAERTRSKNRPIDAAPRPHARRKRWLSQIKRTLTSPWSSQDYGRVGYRPLDYFACGCAHSVVETKNQVRLDMIGLDSIHLMSELPPGMTRMAFDIALMRV